MSYALLLLFVEKKQEERSMVKVMFNVPFTNTMWTATTQTTGGESDEIEE